MATTPQHYPLPFYQKWKYLHELRELTDKKIFDSRSTYAYSNLYTKTIYLPFVTPLDFSDLKTLLEHEEKHFDLMPREPTFPWGVDLATARIACNLIEDILVNETLPRHRIERVLRKLHGQTITLWSHLNEEEKEKAVESLKKSILRKDVDVSEFKEALNKAIDQRKEDGIEFYYSDEFKKFLEFFDLSKIAKGGHGGTFGGGIRSAIGDGPGGYPYKGTLPDWALMKKLIKILYNLKRFSEEETVQKRFYGKRINRRYFEDPAEFKPFLHKTVHRTIKLPRVLIVLDESGSMDGTPAERAKAFVGALLETCNCTVIAHNRLNKTIVMSVDQLVKLYETDDEDFDELPDTFKRYGIRLSDYDIFVTVTDMVIDSDEAEGLAEVMNKFTKQKYILCTDDDEVNNYSDLIKVKRVDISNKEQLINFCKKLVGAFS